MNDIKWLFWHVLKINHENFVIKAQGKLFLVNKHHWEHITLRFIYSPFQQGLRLWSRRGKYWVQPDAVYTNDRFGMKKKKKTKGLAKLKKQQVLFKQHNQKIHVNALQSSSRMIKWGQS